MARSGQPVDWRADVCPEAVLSLLDDDGCRKVLASLDEPKTAAEIATSAAISRSTAYRKLDRLRRASLVRPTLEIRTDGHHTWRYEATLDEVTIVVSVDERDSLQFERERSSDSH